MNKKAGRLLLWVILVAPHLNAQNTQRPLYVQVSDSVSQLPVHYATILIQDTTDHLIKSMVTNDSGRWNMPLLPIGNYRMRISAAGYRSKSIAFASKDSTVPVALETILLSVASKELATVTVTAQPPLVKQEIDRLSFDVQADPENKIISVLEMMRKLPLVTLDAEDNIQLKGSSNFRIFINGKPSALLSGNVKDVLRTMPASTIEKIEVITIPPAKYEAEGLAGIINIITAKKIDDGYKATINAYYRLPVAGPGMGSSVSVKKGKWGINFSGGFNIYRSPKQTNGNYRQTTGPPATFLQTDNQQFFDGTYSYAGAELSFAPDSLQLFTLEINTSNNKRNYTFLQSSVLADMQQQAMQHFQLNNDGSNHSNGKGAGINYQLGFKKQKNRLLTLSYKFNRFGNGQQNGISIFNAFNYTVPDYYQQNKSRFTEQTVQADYVHPLQAKGSIEAGIKGIMRSNESDFRYLSQDSSSGKFNEIAAFSNIYNNTQTVWGAYLSFQYGFANWSVKTGLRMEATSVHADFISSASSARQHYFNIIPSISLQRKYANNTSLQLGFTQRIQRPGINQLNPFVDRSSPNFESTGNPALRPVLSNNLEIGFSRIRKLTFIASLSYSFVNNNIQQAVVYQGDTKVTRSFYDNIGKDKTLVGNINITWPLNAQWNINLSGTLGYLWFRGMIGGQTVSNSGIKASFRTSVSYSFGKGWRINENLNYYAPFINLQGTTSPYLNPSLSVSKEIKKFTLSAAVVNYFNTYLKYEQKTAGGGFNQVLWYRYFNRSFTVSLNYRFGKLTKQIEKNKRGINNDDLSGN